MPDRRASQDRLCHRVLSWHQLPQPPPQPPPHPPPPQLDEPQEVPDPQAPDPFSRLGLRGSSAVTCGKTIEGTSSSPYAEASQTRSLVAPPERIELERRRSAPNRDLASSRNSSPRPVRNGLLNFEVTNAARMASNTRKRMFVRPRLRAMMI